MACDHMRSPYDQFAKRLSRDACARAAHVETDAEVEVNAQRFDVWVEPNLLRLARLARYGMLGVIFSQPVVLDIFRCTPSLARMVDSHRKHLNFCHDLTGRKPPHPVPTLWVLSSGRPTRSLKAFGCVPDEGWGPGVYRALPVFNMRIVVIRELPRTRDTLLLRLMGPTSTIKRARRELQALPASAPERRLAEQIALDILDRIPKDRKRRSAAQQEFWEIMHSLAKELREKGRKQGRKQGLEQGLRIAQEVLASVYEEHFGPLPAELLAHIKATRNPKKLVQWSRLVARGDRAAADQAIRAA